MLQKIYDVKESEYLQKNPNWHIEDSPFKAAQIQKMLERNSIQPKTVVEIGCGAGEILNQLHQNMADKTIEFEGFDVAPDAIALCQERAKPRLRFFEEDLLSRTDLHYDLLLMMDVFEHVEDYYNFIRESGKRATYKMYHIPLDISVSSILRNKMLDARTSVGHIHYYSKDTALASIADTGQEIIDYFYTAGAMKLGTNKPLKTRLANVPRKALYALNSDLAVKLFGGYSLLVLAK